MSLDFQTGTSNVAKVADFQDPDSDQDFIGNLGIIQDDFAELAECADDAKETVRDVRDALGVFRSVQKKADKVEKLLDGLEKVASLATKVGAISKPAQALQKIFHQLGEVTGKNVAAALFFWPALAFTYMDAKDAEKLIRERKNHLAIPYR